MTKFGQTWTIVAGRFARRTDRGVDASMKFPAVILTSLVLAGCASGGFSRVADGLPGTAGQEARQAIGGIIGGGLIMGDLGTDLPRRARLLAIDAEYRALESTPAGEPVTWRDERSGQGGTVTAAQPYRVGSQDCRPYEHRVEARGTVRLARGTACRNDDGSWTLLN